MQKILPRYEFRAFAQNFGLVEDKIRTLFTLDSFRESSETYIISKSSTANVKIRYNLLDIKVFVKEEKGLQQWAPKIQEKFPLTVDVIRDEMFSLLDVEIPEFGRTKYSMEQYLGDIIKPHPELSLIRVFKHRFGYIVNECICEIAELLINGAAIKTAAIESANLEKVLETQGILGLMSYENVNYLLAIKRIIGMEPLPE